MVKQKYYIGGSYLIDGFPFLLRYFLSVSSENKSNQEIADAMGISVNTVKSHYQESVKMLRDYFRKIKLMFL